uniref:Macaca fascicularis brain cDNA clone: QflA-18454, similar to human hypothetical protein FLJ30934 (FLJ30934), mRNA, RefSeq: NM_152760.1 n=1 Tax=Macaca fascicularis TaxID=9541 RepID=I7G5S7_MACFA|nr:unnamed protein product [Macaca fascicularis]
METHAEAGKEGKPSCASVDLQGDSSLQVEISDAVSERDKVKFTVQTKTEFSVVRQHEEFIWLHDAYVENEEYAGLIVRRGRAGAGRDRQSTWVRTKGYGGCLGSERSPSSVPPLSRSPQPLRGQTLRLQGKSYRNWARGREESRACLVCLWPQAPGLDVQM